MQAATPFLADLVAGRRGGRARRRRRCASSSSPAPPCRGRWPSGRPRRSRPRSAAPGARPSPAWRRWPPRRRPGDGSGGPTGARWPAPGSGSPTTTGQCSAPASEGNFEVRSRCLFDGYLDRPDLTAAAFTARRLVPHRRPGDDRRRRVPADHRPGQGRDQPRRREGAGGRDRAAAARTPAGRGGGDRRRCPTSASASAPAPSSSPPTAARARSTSRRCAGTSTRRKRRPPVLARAGRDDRRDAPHAEWEDPEVRPARACRGRCGRRARSTTEKEPIVLTQAAAIDRRRLARRGALRGAEGGDRRLRRRRGRAVDAADRGRARACRRSCAPSCASAATSRSPARASTAAAGIPFSRYLELLELFSMSHASLRMIVHVANGVWRSVDQFATDEQRREYVMPAVTGDLTIAFTLTEPTAGTGADLRCEVEREGDTYYLSGEKHLITFGVSCDRWLLFARLAGTSGAEGTVALLVDRDDAGRHRRGHGRVAGRARDRPRAARLRPRPGPGRRPARRGGHGPAGRLRRLPHAEPDRGRDDLRRARPAGAGAGGRARP